MINNTELDILILVYWALTLILKGKEIQENKNICVRYLLRLSNYLDGVWHAVERSSSDDSHPYSPSSDQFSRVRHPTVIERVW